MSPAKNQLVSRIETVKFRWTIEDVSTLKKGVKLCSETFLVGAHRWRIHGYPKGSGSDPLSVALYVIFVDSEKMPDGWIVPADCSLTIVNQLSVDSSVEKSFTCNYGQGQTSWGYISLVPVCDLQPKGFIVNDALIVEVEVSTEPPSSEAAADVPTKIEADRPPKDIKVLPDVLPSQVDNPEFCPPSVQISCRNLISELSTMISSRSSSSSDNGLGLLQQQKEKLLGFFDMSLEAICETKSLDEVENIALEILDQASTDHPLEKTVLKDLISRLAEFKETVPISLSTIETSSVVESSVGRMTKDLEQRLVHKKGQLASLEAEVCRLGEERSKLDVEIQQLNASKAKVVAHTSCTEIELEKAVEDAGKLLDEVNEQRDKRKRAGEERMRAKDKLAQSNASWKLFKENLGW